jgi:hypothetical protein
MKITLQNLTGLPERDFMRKLNYQEHRDRHSVGISYIRRAKPGGPFYPRYHAHVRTEGTQVLVDLHYDWRRPMHVREARSADNRGDVVAKEVARIEAIAAGLTAAAKSSASSTESKKPGWFGRIFGPRKTLK